MKIVPKDIKTGNGCKSSARGRPVADGSEIKFE